MAPFLDPVSYGIALDVGRVFPVSQAFATIEEDEGTTIIAPSEFMKSAKLEFAGLWARITLKIHSSLEAVGLTAAFATALKEAGISANVIAGFHHDHIFVQWDKRHEAMSALVNLSQNSQ
jgi:uncharacterized protein